MAVPRLQYQKKTLANFTVEIVILFFIPTTQATKEKNTSCAVGLEVIALR